MDGKKVKIRMLQSLAGLYHTLQAQDEIETDEETAKNWSEHGLAEIIEVIEEPKTPKKKKGDK